jgi:hypothetical protein
MVKLKCPKSIVISKKVWLNNKIFRDFRNRDLHECQACAFIFNKNKKDYDPYGITAFKKL